MTITCPNTLIKNVSSLVKIQRWLMADNHKKCPKRIVPCRYRSIGCKTLFKREDTSLHEEECIKKHLDEAVATIEGLQNQVRQLKVQVEDSTRKIGTPLAIKADGLLQFGDKHVSMGFYTSKSGHKISLKLERIYDFLQGNFMNALTVCIAAMPGRYDDILR